jgi:hypothetical protein
VLQQAHLRAFLQERVRDGVITRLIGKWLRAGVMEQEVSVTLAAIPIACGEGDTFDLRSETVT